jgi:hypothetical protein
MISHQHLLPGEEPGGSIGDDVKRIVPILLLAFLAAGIGCGRKRAGDSGDGPVGGAAIFDRALETAVSRAEPDGDVLVIGWTSDSPPPRSLYDLIRRWRPYGLIAIGVNPDLATSADRKGTIARVRRLELENQAPMRSLLYDGAMSDVFEHFDGVDAVPFLALIDTRGKTIWSDRGFGELTLLDALLKSRLGEPPIAALQ